MKSCGSYCLSNIATKRCVHGIPFNIQNLQLLSLFSIIRCVVCIHQKNLFHDTPLNSILHLIDLLILASFTYIVIGEKFDIQIFGNSLNQVIFVMTLTLIS